MHTDRSAYFTGEEINFSVFHVDGTFHQPISWSKVLYVEIIGADRMPVLQNKVLLKEGGATGSIFLPATINSGNYEIRAYTNWMKNFNSAYFFHQTIRIINPFTSVERQESVQPQYDVQFFPEGGNLVQDLESVVAVRAVDRSGVGVFFKGAIINETNDTLVRFSPLKFGLEKFRFKPEAGHRYKAIIIDTNKKQFSYSLPPVATEGLVMQVTETNTKIRIAVKGSKQFEEKPVHLFAHTRLMLKLNEQQIVKDGEAVFFVDKSKLSAGVSHLTVFNEHLVPVCERLFFIPPDQQLNLVPKLNQSVFSTREKVDVELAPEINGKHSDLSALSVFVSKVDSLDLPKDNIVSYLWLSSDLNGQVENPSYYLEEETIERKAAIENLLLTHGWRRFRWENILQDKQTQNHVPELRGEIITGKVTDTSGMPASMIITYLSLSGLPINPYISRSDSAGNIVFEIKPVSGKKNLIVQTDKEHQIKLNDAFFQETSDSYTLPDFYLSGNLEKTATQRSIHMQVMNSFHPPKLQVPVKGKHETQSFYGKPDNAYRLDDYTRFPTLEEVLREYVPGVRVKKSKDGFQLSNLDIVNRSFFNENPLTLIDGVPIFDMNALLEIDPLKLKKLDVMTKRYYLQAANFGGVVSFTSYQNDLAGYQLPTHAMVTTYNGFAEEREFFKPSYETQTQRSSSIPDTRYVLYKSPDNLASGSVIKFNFFTSDIVGKYNIVVQGITKEGVPGYFSTTFEVK